MKALLLGFAVAILAGTATAGDLPRKPGQADRAIITARLCPQQPVRVLRTKAIPADARIQRVRAWVNGHELTGWLEGRQVAGLGGYAVVVQMTFLRKAGPAVVRIASARPNCTAVRVVAVWT